MAGGSIPSHKWHRVANTHPQNKIPKDTEKVESERMGRAMLDNNNQKKADVTNTRKKISKPKALLQIEFTSLVRKMQQVCNCMYLMTWPQIYYAKPT